MKTLLTHMGLNMVMSFEMAILSDNPEAIYDIYQEAHSNMKIYFRSIHYLVYAVKHNKFASVKELIEHIGIPVSNRNYYPQPITEAIKNMSYDTKMIEYLVSKGANLKVVDECGADAITTAATYRNFKALKILLDMGGDLIDQLYILPFQIAIYDDDISLAKILLDHGADPYIKKYGKTIFDEAKEYNGRIYKFLTSYKPEKTEEKETINDDIGGKNGEIEIIIEIKGDKAKIERLKKLIPKEYLV
jgi:ankyrin repeat protein